MKNRKLFKKIDIKIPRRITGGIVLCVFLLLLVAVGIAVAVVFILQNNLPVDEEDLTTLYILVLAGVSLVLGVALSYFLSLIVVNKTKPYVEALRRVADCDFSTRVEEGEILGDKSVSEGFNKMVEQLASVETLREDFVSEFSHEFKTPIVSIAGFAKLLKDPTLSQEDRDEYLDVIIDESNRLVGLSESVLMLSRLDSQTIVKEMYSWDEQIRQSVLLLQKQCQQNNVSVEVDLPKIDAYGCKKLNSQVWVNLLSNAIKFSTNGGVVKVVAIEQNGRVQVSVSDNGVGMDEETQKNIFNKFFQGDKSHSVSGNGLGLPIVKKICDLLGGEIDVHSTLGQGSTFTVTLPTN